MRARCPPPQALARAGVSSSVVDTYDLSLNSLALYSAFLKKEAHRLNEIRRDRPSRAHNRRWRAGPRFCEGTEAP